MVISRELLEHALLKTRREVHVCEGQGRVLWDGFDTLSQAFIKHVFLLTNLTIKRKKKLPSVCVVSEYMLAQLVKVLAPKPECLTPTCLLK